MDDDIVEEYARWMRACGHSRTTVTARRRFAAARIRDLGLGGFTRQGMVDYFGGEDMEEASAWTRSTYFNHMKELTAWLKAAGYIEADPMLSMKRGASPSSLPRPLSNTDVDRVLAAATGEVRDWVEIALLSGLRVSEIAKLRGEDVTPEGLYVQGKGGKRATLPCHPGIWEIAQRYPRSGFWFPGNDRGHIRTTRISKAVGKVFDDLGLAGSIHRCRHTYATRLLRSGAHIRTVQKLMRHSNVSTTAAYTAVDEDELFAAVTMLPPLPSRPEPPAA